MKSFPMRGCAKKSVFFQHFISPYDKSLNYPPSTTVDKVCGFLILIPVHLSLYTQRHNISQHNQIKLTSAQHLTTSQLATTVLLTVI